MRIEFTKMHGCGNDYIYVNGTETVVEKEKKAEVVRRLSDRHFGIGGDGVIFIHPLAGKESDADFEMEMYNADGSRAEMCGNGIRCVAKYVYDKGLTDKTEIRVISCGKVKYLELTTEEGKVKSVKVNMGAPVLKAEDIPVISGQEEAIAERIEVEGKEYEMTCVSMGNPHAVIFIWERGTGETLACGTGACATVVACILNGLTEEEVTVKLLGGELKIKWDREENTVYMTGPAETVFDGRIEIDI